MLNRLLRRSNIFPGLVILGIVVAGAVYILLGLNGKRTLSGFPVVSTTQQVLEESTLLFNIPVDETNIRYGPRYNKRVPYYMQGFASGDDGTFWLIDVSRRLLRYSSEGALLTTIELPAPLRDSEANILDVKARGPDLWILAFVGPIMGPRLATLFKLSHSGQELARYVIPDNSTVRPGKMIFGEHGEILLYTPSINPQLWQFLDSQGTLALLPLDGYTKGGRLYSAQLDDPADHFNKSGTVETGNVKLSIRLTEPNMYLSGVCVCHVNPDGSFYVFTEEWDRNSIGFFPQDYRSVLYYSAEGTAIDRVPQVLSGNDDPGSWLWSTSSWDQHLALGADGSIYLLMAMPEERGNTTHFEVRRLKFGDRAE
ncbi:MAG TPA: hypothetical protein VEW94_03200 [Chloroflexia bacterium]|nr:hypothetical protein [Chloroflexia bacterium]